MGILIKRARHLHALALQNMAGSAVATSTAQGPTAEPFERKIATEVGKQSSLVVETA